jgi:hypothetical protein
MRAGPKLVKAVDADQGGPDKGAGAVGIAEVQSPSDRRDVPPEPPPFTIFLRDIYQPAGEARAIEGESSRVVVERALAADVSGIDEPIMTWTDGNQLSAVDFDRPDGAPPLTESDLLSFFPPYAPVPLAAWITHGGGLRAA